MLHSNIYCTFFGPKETKIPLAIYFLFVPQSFLKVLYLIPRLPLFLSLTDSLDSNLI